MPVGDISTRFRVDPSSTFTAYEHQLALKRRRFFGDGSLNMGDLEIDRAMLTSLASCRPR